ncbi:MAG: hypothetical protein JWP63_3310 [Candidatus Solibacter sp.]|nr:hypothetical protein [Candidatus Solibacter sp.]
MVCGLLNMMTKILIAACAAAMLWSPAAPAQTPTRSMVGTVSAFKAESAEIEIKPDNGVPVAFKVTADTMAQKVAPGVTDLKQAEAIKVTEVALGDRVLATPEAGTSNLRRIVVMSATEIEKKNAADKADWSKRGVSGVVASKSGNDITLKIRTMGGEQLAVVTVTGKTTFKRYAPVSVKFADAHNSKIAEIAVGDQVRARGQKSEDGLKVMADDVVFGTFVTKAGAITAINPETREVTVKDLSNNKPLTIKFTADSQMKKMPDMGGMMGRGGAAMGGAPGGMARGGMPGRGGMGGMDINAMLERMPQTKLEDLKPGELVVVSSTKGAKSDQVTAIMMLANADMLLQMAAAQSGGGAGRSGGGMSGGMGGMMGGGGMDALGGMGLGGIIP